MFCRSSVTTAESGRERIDSGMLKNAIESADYYPDSRKRRHSLQWNYEEGIMLQQARCRASTMTVFHKAGVYFEGVGHIV
jgi:hypothetical protein